MRFLPTSRCSLATSMPRQGWWTKRSGRVRRPTIGAARVTGPATVSTCACFATALTLSGRRDEAETLYREALVRAKPSFGTSAFILYDATTFLARQGDLQTAARVGHMPP